MPKYERNISGRRQHPRIHNQVRSEDSKDEVQRKEQVGKIQGVKGAGAERIFQQQRAGARGRSSGEVEVENWRYLDREVGDGYGNNCSERGNAASKREGRMREAVT